MKKYLITGAAGLVGKTLLEELLKTNNYEITALDLKNPKNQKELNKYKKDINIVYGDITDKVLINALVKDHDVIIHLAGVMPPTSEIHPNLVDMIDYGGSKLIVDAIKEHNPKAYLIFLSTTTMYGNVKRVKLDDELNIYNDDIYSQNKYKIENYIKKNITNYTIYRVPMILAKANFNVVMFNVPKDAKIEVITDELVTKALLDTLKNKSKLNKHTYILSGGEKYRTTSKELFINVLKNQGISLRYFVMTKTIPLNFYGHYYEENSKLNAILSYQKGSIKEIYESYEKNKKFTRCFHRLIGKFIIKKLSK